MTDSSSRAVVLSPQRKELLHALLREQGIVTPDGGGIPRRDASTQPATEPQKFPLSFSQERIWFLDQLLPGSDLFNLNSVWRFTYAVDMDILQQSLNEVVRRHESLRTVFSAVDGEPVQVIIPELEPPLTLIDLRDSAESEREEAARRFTTEEARQPFDLERGPLLRACLLRMREDEYIFLMIIHHIIADGWSLQIFWEELLTVWTAFSNEEASELPELPIQYADFAVWQRDWLTGPVLEAQLGYWTKQLADLPLLQLPTDHPRPPVQTAHGATHPIVLSDSLSAGLRALSQEQEVTLFMTILAAFQTLLYRYSRQDDVAVGTFIANRNRAETEGLIGFFVNALVLRTDFSSPLTFKELLRQVREITLDAYAHQDLPFARLVRELQPGPDLSRNPLFQVAFQFLNIPGLMLDDPGSESASETPEVPRGTAILDLTCTFWESEGRLAGEIEYNTDIFEASTIQRMACHYELLLESIVADPDLYVQYLPLLHNNERRRILVEWNDTRKTYPCEASIVSLFEAQVARTPDAPALHCEGDELSYEELNRRANQLAWHLVGLGIRPESRVGMCGKRSIDTVVGLLAILKAGGVYVPLDPSYPQDRLAYMVEDAGLEALICRTHFPARLPQSGARIVRLDDQESADCGHESNPGIRVTPHMLAYVIYTSGSTGKPKGVAVEHRQVLNRLRWMWDAYPFAPGEISCHKTALNFVDSLWELLGPLLQGIPTIIIPDELARDPAALVGALSGARVSRIWLVPSMLRVLLATHPDLGQRLPELTFWVASGEELSAELFDLFSERHPRAALYNLYGTSEVWDATWYDPRHDGSSDACVPIGRPIANTQAFVLDSRLQPVPVGVPGELHIGGVGLARGYLDRPGLTAQKFIPHPFSSERGARLYKTGDLARHRADGIIEFLGRMDRQVKLRGFRIELGEVETALMRHEAIREAAVLLREDNPGEPRLVAYIVPHPQDQPAEGISGLGVRQFLRRTLPDYMVPSAFVPLAGFPLTPNGKLDRRALPPPDARRSFIANTYVAPRTPEEEQLARIFGQLLGLDHVGVYDNFFDLGGHSLLAIRAVSQMREAFQVEITLRAIFEAPTIAGIEQILKDAQTCGDSYKSPSIVSLPRAAHAATLLPDGELDLEAILHERPTQGTKE